MRNSFAAALTLLAKTDSRIHLVTGDVGGGLFDGFRAACPGRHIEFGIAEQSMVGFAAGMAIAGLRPVVYTITPFLIERAFEQIKLDINEQNVPVGIVGYSGYPTYGPSHNELDAETVMGLFQNIRSMFPKSAAEAGEMVLGVDFERPWFLALKKA
jgi:transketolase